MSAVLREPDTTGLIPSPAVVPPQALWPYTGTVFERHFVTASVSHGKCEACGEKEIGLAILPASMCSVHICARCFFDLHSRALPALSREYAKWAQR